MNNYMNSQVAFGVASTVAGAHRRANNQTRPEPLEICCDDNESEIEEAQMPGWKRAVLGLLELPLSVTTPMMQGFKMGRY